MKTALDQNAQDQLFNEARSINTWTDSPVSDEVIKQLYDLVKMGPTSANCSPSRFIFLKSQDAREKLVPYLMEGNIPKVKQAPLTVIIGYDMDFAQKMPYLFPHNPDAQNWFNDPNVAFETAFRNSSLQGAYLMLAARSLGLDCGPMSGFDPEGVKQEFFAGTNIKPNFICSLGVGSSENIFPRSPRLTFEDGCQLL